MDTYLIVLFISNNMIFDLVYGSIKRMIWGQIPEKSVKFDVVE